MSGAMRRPARYHYSTRHTGRQGAAGLQSGTLGAAALPVQRPKLLTAFLDGPAICRTARTAFGLHRTQLSENVRFREHPRGTTEIVRLRGHLGMRQAI